jgi:putative chitinase
MPLLLTPAAVRQIFPEAPQAVIDAFASTEGQRRLQSAGITDNAQRIAVAMAHCHHETGGFTIRNLTENINYSAERMAVVWPNRFPSAAAVRAKYGTAPGWQKKAFDDIYGNRMGNRPGTGDGGAFIGRGAPQVTGRDGYREVGLRSGLPLEAQPDLACLPANQPFILAAFWMWKGMGPLADKVDNEGKPAGIDATVRPWNGGTNGLADRKAQFARILPIVKALPIVAGPQPTPAAPPSPVRGDLIAAFVNFIINLFRRKS